MHLNFADWYRPASFGHNRDTLELRWQGVEAALEQIDDSIVLELIRLVFGRPLQSPGVENTFRKFFKDTDQSFLTTGNDLEVKVLAGCVLAMTCVEPISPLPTMAILTTSVFGLRELQIEIDLIGMVASRVHSDGIRARKRIRADKLKPFEDAAYNEAILPLSQPQTPALMVQVLNNIGAVTVSQLNTLQNAIADQQALLEIQDEELQLLWWVVGERSDKWGKAFTGLNTKARPILLAAEAAAMTTGFSEPPSLRAIFSRVGVSESDKVTIHECVNACGTEHLKLLAPSDAGCTSIFPVHFAMFRALEAGANSTWVAPWTKATGITAKAKLSAVELAMQVHRECQLMAYMESKK